MSCHHRLTILIATTTKKQHINILLGTLIMKFSSTITLVTTILSIVSPSVTSAINDNRGKLRGGGHQLAVVTEDASPSLEVVVSENEDWPGTNRALHDVSSPPSAEVNERRTSISHFSSQSFYGYYGYACRTDGGGGQGDERHDPSSTLFRL
jgi:hypothetical protein